MKSSKMAKKATALKGFMNSMSKPKMQMGDKYTSKDSSDYVRLSKEKKKYVDDAWNYSGSIKGPEKRKFPDSPARAKYNETSRKILANPYFQQKVAPLNKPSMKKGGESEFPDLTGDGKVTRADVLKGRGVFKKGGMSRMANEGFKNAKRTITDGYKGTGAPNPLAAIVKNTATKKATIEGLGETVIPTKKKPKMAMGGDFFPQNPLTMSKYQTDNLNNQYYKKGGMIKKKKK